MRYNSWLIFVHVAFCLITSLPVLAQLRAFGITQLPKGEVKVWVEPQLFKVDSSLIESIPLLQKGFLIEDQNAIRRFFNEPKKLNDSPFKRIKYKGYISVNNFLVTVFQIDSSLSYVHHNGNYFELPYGFLESFEPFAKKLDIVRLQITNREKALQFVQLLKKHKIFTPYLDGIPRSSWIPHKGITFLNIEKSVGIDGREELSTLIKECCGDTCSFNVSCYRANGIGSYYEVKSNYEIACLEPSLVKSSQFKVFSNVELLIHGSNRLIIEELLENHNIEFKLLPTVENIDHSQKMLFDHHVGYDLVERLE